ncbi:hypothetical protein FP74_gp256 [Bacillus phage CAM003]|uniref:Uncharacterized protein n=1 Tax=Bacillus phage CAM003 TaxID=1486657 RepID=A0A024AZC9_9CAUD|nr:hypothetical protein FP74_gp256 [Bacillus phage CAM003]AHZ09540.1 hypothetical protein [Bacillus phage CAM003]
MPLERRDKSGALIFAPTDSEIKHLATLRNIQDKSEELDTKLAEVDKMKEDLTALIAQMKEKVTT